MSTAGTYSRVPMGEAFDVMCNELDDIVNRVCGIEEVALAYAWLQNVRAGLGGAGVVGQAAGSGSAATNGEPERTPAPPSTGQTVDSGGLTIASQAVTGRACESGRRMAAAPGLPPSPNEQSGLVGEPPPAEAWGNGGSPTRHLAAVPTEAT